MLLDSTGLGSDVRDLSDDHQVKPSFRQALLMALD
jgi:hypothetical protein